MSAFKSLAIIALAAFATAMPTAVTTGNNGGKGCTGTQAAQTCNANQQLNCCQDGLLGLDCLLIDLLDLPLTDTCTTGTVNCCSGGGDTGLIVLDLSCSVVNLDLLGGL
ncbi:hypothetical protein LTR78_008649 [Recurvomyces mirabilis]|uniref:Hydrophobin n=1 Tax=Recurvomyces mirabilis TaxID=574656 RepID=A0AAE0WIX8_9PEZI|nr:hypothetical protein LTR78_008649 [Recurvomyces mirabilis]KAK5153440.1 hypothetical protein LTS14_007610 [Recurvomyces mirabilis]